MSLTASTALKPNPNNMKDHNTLRTFAVATLLLAGTLHAQHTRTGKGESYWNNTWEWHHQLEHQFDAQGQEVLYTHYLSLIHI